MPLVGRNGPPGQVHIQTLVFKKDEDWTKAGAHRWLEENNHFTDGFHETDTSYRYRQYDPQQDKFNYATKTFGTSKPVSGVVAYPKDKPKKKSPTAMHVHAALLSHMTDSSSDG